MHHFLDPQFNVKQGTLSPEESEHATRVLRLKSGDKVSLCNGHGTTFEGRLQINGQDVSLEITDQNTLLEPKSPIILAIAPPKNPSRLEWLLEKATEIGVDRIVPITTMRGERPRIKLDRAERIIHAACKQSKRAFIPKVEAMMTFSDFLKEKFDFGFIAHCLDDGSKLSLREAWSSISVGSKAVLIGPEGDFHPEEVQAALNAGYQSIDLGPNRLRTETAALYAITLAAAFR